MPKPLTTNQPFFMQWLLLGSALLILVGFVAQDIYFEHQRIASRERTQLLTQAKVVDQNMARQLDAINRALVAVRSGLKGGTKSKDADVIHQFKTLVNAMPGVRTILVTDARGTVTASNREQIIGQNFQSRHYFQTPLRKPSADTLYVSPPFTTSLGVYSINLARAILDSNGRFAGVVSATLAPDQFEVLMNSVRYAPDMWSFLAHGSGAIFMMTPERQDLAGKNMALPGTLFTRHVASGQVANVYTGTVYATGENRISAWRSVQPKNLHMDAPLVIVVARDLSAVFAAWRHNTYVRSGLLATLMLFSVLGLTLYQRRQRTYLDERERIEQRLHETSEELERFFTLSLDLLCIADMQGRFLRLNLAWETTLGYPLAELVGRSFLDFVHPDDMTATLSAMSRLETEKKDVLGFTNRYRCKDGAYRWIEWHSKPFQQTLIYAVARDVTERKLAEKEREEMRRNQRALLNAIQETTLLVERDGTVRVINEVGAKRLKATPEALIGKNLLGYFPPQAAALSRTKFDEIARSGKPVFYEDERSGHRFSNAIYPIVNTQGEVTSFAVYAAEITRQHRQKLIDDSLSEINQEILQGVPLQEVLAIICQKVSAAFQLEVVWLGRKEKDGVVDILAAAGPAANYVDAMKIAGVRWDDTPQGRGPAGSAIRFGQPQLFKVNDPRFQTWSGIALKNNLQSIFSIPLVIRGEIHGVFVLYSSDPAMFDSTELTSELRSIGKRICIALEATMDQQQVRLLSSALEATVNGVFITDPNGVILWVNPALSKLCGYSKEELLGQTPRIFKSAQQSAEYYRTLWETIGKGENWSGETVERAKDGRIYTVSQSITPIIHDGELTHYIAIHDDISAQKLSQAHIQHMAHFDALTGLPNRALFYDRLHQALLLAKRNSSELALMYLDLDGFKQVNDSLGHHAGDLLLVCVAERLSKCIRQSDTVARLGGDEFTLILNEARNQEDIAGVAQKIIEAIAEPFDLEGRPAQIGVSIGIARFQKQAGNEDELMRLADAAMYEAKSAGKNTYRFSEAE